MSIFTRIIHLAKETANISDYIDTESAANTIRTTMSFKGPNVWILAFSIIIASVGLNLNSIPVIIGAMLISPLMGPIYGIGLGLGTNDLHLLREAFKNFIIMVAIALAASMVYFIVTPLHFANPTELEARTNPSIYDVMIALFGGLAGIFELCRKKPTGTVLSGVAIATALMPPLCTAGYGLAHLDGHFFFGALFLFCINLVFISLATYFMVKYLKFPEASYMDEKRAKKTRQIITAVVAVIVVPSLWSAFEMIRYNNFEQRVIEFVQANKDMQRVYIYDYHVEKKNGGYATIHVAGEALDAETKAALISSAESFGLREHQVSIKEHSLANEGPDNSEILLKGVYERTDAEINKREMQIRQLENELSAFKAAEIPYLQIAREVKTQYPEINDLSISKGENVQTDSLKTARQMVIVATSEHSLGAQKIEKLTNWFKIRLEDSTVVVINLRPDGK